MRIERNFAIQKETAIQKLDTLIDELVRGKFSDGTSVKDFSKSWSDNVMTFSFKVKKGFMGITLSGSALVNDNSAILDFELPALLKAFVSEDEIRSAINKQFDKLFAD